LVKKRAAGSRGVRRGVLVDQHADIFGWKKKGGGGSGGVLTQAQQMRVKNGNYLSDKNKWGGGGENFGEFKWGERGKNLKKHKKNNDHKGETGPKMNLERNTNKEK